jgi:hypothetical protein
VTPVMNDSCQKTAWQRVLLSVQPRIRLTRSFDQRSHSYLGYSLKVRGRIGNNAREFLVGWVEAVTPNTGFRQVLLSPALLCRFRTQI